MTATVVPGAGERRHDRRHVTLPWRPDQEPRDQRLHVHGPDRHVQLHQGQHGRRAPRQAAAAHRRGREGPARHRRPRADPGHDHQHAAGGRLDGRRPDHVVPVPGRRHQDRHRAARPPQQGGVAQAHDRGLADHRLRHASGRHETADHRDAHDHVDDPPEGRRDELPRGPHPEGLVERRRARSRSSATFRSSASSSTHTSTDDKRTDLFLTLTPHIIRSPADHGGGPHPDLGRHREQRLASRASTRGSSRRPRRARRSTRRRPTRARRRGPGAPRLRTRPPVTAGPDPFRRTPTPAPSTPKTSNETAAPTPQAVAVNSGAVPAPGPQALAVNSGAVPAPGPQALAVDSGAVPGPGIAASRGRAPCSTSRRRPPRSLPARCPS